MIPHRTELRHVPIVTFTPQTDLTAYELAQILVVYGVIGGGPHAFLPLMEMQIPVGLKRHFTVTGTEERPLLWPVTPEEPT